MRDPELTIPEHRDLVEALAQPLPAVEAPLESCTGAVLAEDVRAAVPVPPFTNSAMDGFALRFDDIAGLAAPVTLPVLGDIPAGDTIPRECRPGAAWRIMTGAPMPAGADTVVRVEATDHSPGVAEAPEEVTISRLPEIGADVRHRGEAVEPGDIVVRAGAVLRGQELAAAASVGHGALRVHPRPRVVIVTTGAELAAAGNDLAHGQIPDSNGFLLRGLVEEAGGVVAAHLRTGDSPGQLRAALDRAPLADLVITAGGISQGAHEVVRRALGADAGFHRVAQQPGVPRESGAPASATARRPSSACRGTPSPYSSPSTCTWRGRWRSWPTACPSAAASQPPGRPRRSLRRPGALPGARPSSSPCARPARTRQGPQDCQCPPKHCPSSPSTPSGQSRTWSPPCPAPTSSEWSHPPRRGSAPATSWT